MNWMGNIARVFWLSLAFTAASGQAADPLTDFQAAAGLEREGKDHEAFLKFLSVPGGEDAAVTLARPKPKEFLEVLQAVQPALSPRARLVEADLLLALGRKDEARRLFHQLVTEKLNDGWGTARADYYPVELQHGEVDDQSMPMPANRSQLLEPFTFGPGSHRDNWLLRRLLALGLDDDASQEFSRLWRIHQTNTEPYAVVVPAYDAQGSVVSRKKHLVRPAGFNGQGLQFALDYAFFLQREGKTNAALEVLLPAMKLCDLDRDPNAAHPGEEISEERAKEFRERLFASPRYFFGFGGSAGTSRKEFLRLAYGEFKAAGRENELLAAIRRQINSGENRARRVLARLHSLAGQPDAALALELEYIARGGFNEASAEWRRGLVYESVQKNAEAVASLERFLNLPASKLDLPDAEEREAGQFSALAMSVMGQRDEPPSFSPQQADALTRLQRLHSALGQTDKALDATLRLLGLNDVSLGAPEGVEQIAQRFKTAGQEQRFTDWARQRVRDTKDPRVRACLAWHLQDYAAVIDAVARDASANTYGLAPWKERFAKLGLEQHRALLRAIIAANPKDSITRLELLDLEARLDGPDAIAALELLLDTEASTAFQRGKGARNRTQFKTYLDLAYRLARLYERNGAWDKLQALALRIARGEKPFHEFDQNLYFALDTNGLEEHGNAALAVAIQHADDAGKQSALRDALKNSRWAPARAQLERRLGAAPPDAHPLAVPWFNVPSNVTVFASAENVLSIARDDRFVYAGQPWGVSVYDFSGTPVARIALGEAAQALAATPRELWVGTPMGLFRITRTNAQWTVAHQWLHEDVAPRDRHSRSFPGGADYWFDNGVYSLTLDDEQLWIGLHRNIQVLNTRTLELRAFSFGELKISHWAGFDRIVPERDYVWASSPHVGLRRFHRASGTWEAPEETGEREPVRLIDIVDGEVFGDVYLNDTLRHRPAFIDRVTLKVTPIPLEAGRDPNERMINDHLQYYGKLDGQLAFGLHGTFPKYVLDRASGKLRPLGAVAEKFQPIRPAFRAGRETDPLDGARVAVERCDRLEKLLGRPSVDGWEFLMLPDGARVFRAQAHYVRYQYPHEDVADSLRDGSETAGGLFFVARAGGVRRVSSADGAGLRGDSVFSIAFDDEAKHDWLCTSVGLAQLERDGRIGRAFTRADGLCANYVTSGAKIGGWFYFASGWGHSAGGLIAFDPRTSVFTSWHRTDGLDADKLGRVELDGPRLKLTFGIERYFTGGGEYLQSPLGWFDPATGIFTSGGDAKRLTSAEAEPSNRNSRREAMPLLGGWVTEKTERNGMTYWCGTRGLVIARGNIEPPRMASLGARVITDPEKALLAEAKRESVPYDISVARLGELLAHTNGFVRARALAAARHSVVEGRPDYTTLISGAVNDPVMRVRATAVWLLAHSRDDGAAAPLRVALNDSDRHIRAVAALALARRGQRFEMNRFEEMFARKDRWGNFPFDADSSVGAEVNKERIYEALSPRADREVFQLFLKYPLESSDHEPRTNVFTKLGAALRRQPEIAADLLAAYQAGPRWEQGPVRFAEKVFQSAGSEILPVLHRALTNDDRVIRSNAARGCGGIGDAASVPHLLAALDLESGLSRASIVWALGEIKATNTLARLIELYTDARNDEQRRAGTGFRYAQAAVAASAQFDSLRSLSAISGDWDELKAAAAPKPRDPRRNEELLSPMLILEAVKKIGPAAAQDFYRALAGAKGEGERNEAAVQLAACLPGERETNRAVLRNLLSDSYPPVRVRAAVSLVLLEDASAETWLRERLKAGDVSDRVEIVNQLFRLAPARRDFARAELEAVSRDDKMSEYTRARVQELLKAPARKPGL